MWVIHFVQRSDECVRCRFVYGATVIIKLRYFPALRRFGKTCRNNDGKGSET